MVTNLANCCDSKKPWNHSFEESLAVTDFIRFRFTVMLTFHSFLSILQGAVTNPPSNPYSISSPIFGFSHLSQHHSFSCIFRVYILV
jgi:hypothetical protein